MSKEYEVVGPRKVHGHSTGDKFKAELHPDLEFALVEGGHVKVLTKPEPRKCDYCQAHGNKKEKNSKYEDVLKLREHYAKEHPGLAAPSE